MPLKLAIASWLACMLIVGLAFQALPVTDVRIDAGELVQLARADEQWSKEVAR